MIASGESGAPFFEVELRDVCSAARTGFWRTPHGGIPTPVFMPVGTHATVKGLTPRELEELGAGVILANAYHLYLRPGVDLIEEAGGIHRFMGWSGPILTDSGGFQIFSLEKDREILPEGLSFKSHLDGTRHRLTPEDLVQIQARLGVDFMMPLDVCAAFPESAEGLEKALVVTGEWLGRSVRARAALPDCRGLLFGIIQGGTDLRLRKRSARLTVETGVGAFAIGGLSVGEPRAAMADAVSAAMAEIPGDAPRYLMGVGYPEDLFLAVERGVDMFDCVAPTRNGRNGTVFSSEGPLHLRNARWARDWGPIDGNCPCYVCKNHSRAYLRHLFLSKEMLGPRLASLHNLAFYIELLKSMRRSISEGRFIAFKKAFFDRYKTSEGTME